MKLLLTLLRIHSFPERVATFSVGCVAHSLYRLLLCNYLRVFLPFSFRIFGRSGGHLRPTVVQYLAVFVNDHLSFDSGFNLFCRHLLHFAFLDPFFCKRQSIRIAINGQKDQQLLCLPCFSMAIVSQSPSSCQKTNVTMQTRHCLNMKD